MDFLTKPYILCNVLLLLSLLNIYAYTAATPVITNVYQGGVHSEGPHWSEVENALYWVDINLQMIHRLDAATGNITTRDIGYGPVSLVITVRDYPKLVIVTVRAELYLLEWDAPAGDAALRLLSVVDLGKPDDMCNDGKADAEGRLWFGTLGMDRNKTLQVGKGTLYMLDQDNYLAPTVEVESVSASNGIAWTSDNASMFYIDSLTRNVDVFDYDIETGTIGNRQTLFSFEANNVTGFPDGMTIDTDENLWVACYNGGKVIKIDSQTGELLEEYDMPATKVSSVMWGGEDLSTLYVTTSKLNLSEEELLQQPEAGSLFAIDGLGACGYAEHQFVFNNADNY